MASVTSLRLMKDMTWITKLATENGRITNEEGSLWTVNLKRERPNIPTVNKKTDEDNDVPFAEMV